MLSGKWKKQLYNDLNPLITGLFVDSINGKYHDERRVITREEFFEQNETDAYVRYLWSFGNKGTTYLWGKDIEDYKLEACHAFLDELLPDRRIAFRHLLRMLQDDINNGATREQTYDMLESLTSLQSVQRLEALHRLETLRDLDTFKNLEVTNIDYHDYVYQEGDIVYCDVPYEETRNNKNKCKDYGLVFDSLEFYRWAKEQPFQVFFSSYEISDDSFYKLKIKEVQNLMSSTNQSGTSTEYLYSNKEINHD